jgi:3-hydroxyacyl-[acyl-carrier-protein] dehydratase
MRFCLIDRVLEQDDQHIVAVKHVTSAEEYLLDHFPSFPILPGVMMLEVMVQAARRLAAGVDPDLGRHVLGTVKALKYGAMIKPGDALRVEISLLKRDGDTVECKGVGKKIPVDGASEGAELQTAVSGRFTLRPLRAAAPAG